MKKSKVILAASCFLALFSANALAGITFFLDNEFGTQEQGAYFQMTGNGLGWDNSIPPVLWGTNTGKVPVDANDQTTIGNSWSTWNIYSVGDVYCGTLTLQYDGSGRKMYVKDYDAAGASCYCEGLNVANNKTSSSGPTYNVTTTCKTLHLQSDSVGAAKRLKDKRH